MSINTPSGRLGRRPAYLPGAARSWPRMLAGTLLPALVALLAAGSGGPAAAAQSSQSSPTASAPASAPVAPDPGPTAADLARLQAVARAQSDAGLFSGVVLVAREGRVLFERAYGASDERSARPNFVTTRFNLASAGKMFTAVAVLQQIALGRATLDMPVGQFLKDYPNREFATRVTLRHLLTHQAGAGDIELFGIEGAANRARVHTVAEMLALHGERAPAFAPGTQQQYGNFGHVVLGRIVEQLSGERFEDYLRRHVFAPAGMGQTGFDDCERGTQDTALGYVELDGRRVRNCATLPRRGFPAGGQVSSARDMLRFVRALQQGRLLPPALFAEATRTQAAFMGLGFFATGYGPDVPERDFRWGHGGSADGICTDVRSYPRSGETVIVLANSDPPGCFEVANALHER